MGSQKTPQSSIAKVQKPSSVQRALVDHLRHLNEEDTNRDPRETNIDHLVEDIRDEQEVFKGLFFSVNRLDVTLPDGNPAQRDVIRHPGAVAIVGLSDDGKICLVRQFRAALGRVTLELPAGKLEPGEDPLECAHRELAEETGMRARNMAYMTSIATAAGFADEIIHIFMATGLEAGEASPDDEEFVDVVLMDLSELIDAVLDARIEDSKTALGALLCDAISRRMPKISANEATSAPEAEAQDELKVNSKAKNRKKK